MNIVSNVSSDLPVKQPSANGEYWNWNGLPSDMEGTLE